MTSIPRLSAQDSIDEMAMALDASGCLVVTDILDRSARDRVRAELAPYMDAAGGSAK